jgi:hypothetical protein
MTFGSDFYGENLHSDCGTLILVRFEHGYGLQKNKDTFVKQNRPHDVDYSGLNDVAWLRTARRGVIGDALDIAIKSSQKVRGFNQNFLYSSYFVKNNLLANA